MAEDAPRRRWRGRPWLSRSLRLTAHAIPFVVVTIAIWRIHSSLPSPAGRGEAIVRWVGLSILSTAALIFLDKLARRLLPLATLFKLSLVFPDEAPSRFSIAMRQNTTRSLQRDLEAGDLDPGTPQEAAELLLALVAELSRHDRLTRGHAERTRAYAEMLGVELGLTDDERSKLQWAALLHDIGKLKVPAAILTRSGRLTAREWATLKTHPDQGWALVAPLRPWLGEWTRAVRDHHERWDGDGYPRGLAGTQISRAGRIVAVVDAFDVMTSARSYKQPLSVADARAELARCAGSHFDDEVVRAFLAVGIGRLRLVMGPLSWLAQLPALTRLPVGQIPNAAISTAAAATVAITSAVVPSAVEEPPPAAAREVAIVEMEEPVITAPGSDPTTTTAPSSTTTTTTAPTTTTTTTTSTPDPTTTTAPPTTTTATTTTTTPDPTTTTTTTTTAPPTTTTTTTPPTTTTTEPFDPFDAQAHLGSLGESTAAPVLPLAAAPTASALANYDTNLNADPGRTIKRSNDPLEELDIEEFQIWALHFESPWQATGTPKLDIWVAAEDFDLDSRSSFVANVAECTSPEDCTTLATAQVFFDQSDFGSDFGLVTVSFTPIDETIDAGNWLALGIIVPNESDDDVWLAFDTTAYPSRGYLD